MSHLKEITVFKIRGYVHGVKQFEVSFDGSESGDEFNCRAIKLTQAMLARPGGDKHMIEIELLEPHLSERFYRFGTDTDVMVQ